MKLVETDIETPPRVDHEPLAVPAPAEHRRVAVSFILTSAVLIATVVSIYVVFPERHNELVSTAVSLHGEPGELDLDAPSHEALIAWSIAVVGKGAPWPAEQSRVRILGARETRVLRLRAAMVRYRIDDQVVTLLVQRARDTPPRTHRRRTGELLAVSWRRKRWTFVAVGRAATSEAWRRVIGAP